MTEFKSLSEICIINPSKREIEIDDKTEVSFVPMVDVSEDGKLYAKEIRKLIDVKKGFTYFQEGDVLIAKITPCFENGKRAIASNLKNGVGFGSTEFHILRPTSLVLGKYIYYIISSKHFREFATPRMKGSAGQKRVPTQIFNEYKINLPALSEQRRIVSMLDRAEYLKELRKQANEEMSKYLQSMFLKMFGDPIINSRNHELKKLSDVSTLSMGGTPDTRRTEYYESGTINWMKSGDIKGDFIFKIPNKITQEGLKNSNTKLYENGTVVIALNGQGKTRGTTGVLKIESCSNQSVAGIKPNKVHLTSEYLHFNLKIRYKQLRDLTGDNQRSGLNLSILRGLDIMIPPMELQKKFTNVVQRTIKFNSNQTESENQINALFDSLLNQAFSDVS